MSAQTIGTFLRPDIIGVSRRVTGSLSSTGDKNQTTVSIVTGVPSRIDVLSISGRLGGDYVLEVEGEVFIATHILFVDGIAPAIFFPTAGPGETFMFKPPGAAAALPYVVDGNGRGAYIDIRAGDRISDENGVTYLALATATYYDINPQRQLRIAQGRAWSG